MASFGHQIGLCRWFTYWTVFLPTPGPQGMERGPKSPRLGLSLSWYNLPSPSPPTSSHLQPHLPPLCLFCLHSAPTPMCTCTTCTTSTNCRSILDPFAPGSHAKGHHLYTLSTFVLFA